MGHTEDLEKEQPLPGSGTERDALEPAGPEQLPGANPPQEAEPPGILHNSPQPRESRPQVEEPESLR